MLNSEKGGRLLLSNHTDLNFEMQYMVAEMLGLTDLSNDQHAHVNLNIGQDGFMQINVA